ncbi:MAG: hypothetical protein IKZ60_06140 [Bacteroidales bacterium]|nr:hypothetical protein [Bacteroidales bacterium]
MKKYYFILAAIAAMLSAVACNKEQNTPDNSEPVEGQEVTIKVTIPEDLSKVALNYTGSALALTWSAGDKITVKDHSNPSNTQDFTLASGEGTKIATFTGTAVSAASYDITLTSNMPSGVGVLAQTQSADANTEHLGYAATLSGVSTYEDVTFSSAWASSNGGTLAQSGALHLQATLPAGVAAVVNGVTMVADKNIFGATGTMNVTISTPADTGSDDVLDVYATIPAGGVSIPSGTNLLFKFNTTDGDHSVYTRHYLTSSVLNLAGGQLNKISLTCTNTDKFAGKDDDGTAAHPYLIADKYQMQAMSSLMAAGETKYFKLVDDIDLDGITWTPLNKDGGYDEAINLDGNGKTISHLSMPLFYTFNGNASNLTIDGATISQSKGNYGIFGRQATVADGAVTNITVKNSSLASENTIVGALFGTVSKNIVISGCVADNVTLSATQQVGGLVGLMQSGSIDNCSASGSATVTTYYAGGMVGLINGSIAGDISISNSHSSVTVTHTTGNNSRVGGLIGQIERTVTIEKCYATGNVTGTGHYGGGLVGVINTADGTVNISKCYATGNVALNTGGNFSHAGGLLGRIDAGTVNISNCYSTGSVTIRRYSGGFVGTSGGTLSITNSYTTSDISGIVLSSYCGLVLGNKTAGTVTCTGFVAWNTCDRLFCYPAEAISTTGNYYGTGGTVSSQATALGWSSSIWDLTGSVPTLK